MYVRQAIFNKLLGRLEESRRLIQVISGPRQVGKTTLIKQVSEQIKLPTHYATADGPSLPGTSWIATQWEIARQLHQEGDSILILDEVQKIPDWSEEVKRLWDEDTWHQRSVKVVLLGSAPLLLQQGLSESLAGRFEVCHVTHWSYLEMQAAFGLTLEQFCFFGGYPGAATMINDEERWGNYVRDSLIETTLTRDILLMTRVDKPALLRQLFHLACDYSSQILSFQKMLGQLQEAGSIVTLAHYLSLLNQAGLVSGLEKCALKPIKVRASSPKLQVMNTALISAIQARPFELAKQDGEYWGRLVESMVGAHLINSTLGTPINVYYWREGQHEVDFVLQRGQQMLGLEIKSSPLGRQRQGMAMFQKKFPEARVLLVGGNGLPLEHFLSQKPIEWFD